MILGDSLLVMTSLAEKEGLKGQVQTIYIDPPYGIKFGSNWQVSTRKRDVRDGKDTDLTRQPEQVRAYRDTWELGIHSYLAYLRDRLAVARELLTESGSVFVQIGDENVHLVRSLLDEVFGADELRRSDHVPEDRRASDRACSSQLSPTTSSGTREIAESSEVPAALLANGSATAAGTRSYDHGSSCRRDAPAAHDRRERADPTRRAALGSSDWSI